MKESEERNEWTVNQGCWPPNRNETALLSYKGRDGQRKAPKL